MKQDLYDRVVRHITENQEKFYRLAYSYVHNQSDALDIVQNAVCKALEHYETLQNPKAVNTWFYRILVNESLLFLKTASREIPDDQQQSRETPYYEAAFDANDDLYSQINRLDADVQTVIKLRFFEELSLKEIAAVTDTNLSTVKARLYRGLNRLRQTMEEVLI